MRFVLMSVGSGNRSNLMVGPGSSVVLGVNVANDHVLVALSNTSMRSTKPVWKFIATINASPNTAAAKPISSVWLPPEVGGAHAELQSNGVVLVVPHSGSPSAFAQL
jgi:hypothetical protein